MVSLTECMRIGVLIAALIGASLLMTAYNLPTGILQQSSIESRWMPGSVPVFDAKSSDWQRALPSQIPLTRQNITQPMLTKPSTQFVVVRSLNNGSWIAFMLEWEASSKHSSTVRIQDFRDGAALQFPLKKGAPPFLGMGQKNSPVNIWHWKADWQEAIDSFFEDIQNVYPGMSVDYYPFAKVPYGVAKVTELDKTFSAGMGVGNPFSLSQYAFTPIEDLNAAGFGTLTTQPHQDVIGKGVWSEGRWKVIFARPMVTADPNDAVFEPGGTTSIAFAIWQGGNREVDGRKSFSNWHLVSIDKGERAAFPVTLRQGTILLGAALVGFGVGFSLYDRARAKAIAAEIGQRREKPSGLALASFLAICWVAFFYLVVTGFTGESFIVRNAVLVQGAIAFLVMVVTASLTRRLFKG